YLRFLSPVRVLPESILAQLACVDYCRRLALVAEVDTPTGVEVAALGSYGAVDASSAEVALVVSDAWQRQGIGVGLAARVLKAAQQRGFHRFVVHTLWENVATRKLLRHVGRIVSAQTQYGVSEVAFVGNGE